MLPFSPDVKMMAEFFFLFQFPRLFWKNILWSKSWFLKTEQKKWNCLHCTSPTLQNYDLFIFLSFTFWPGYGSANLCRSGSEPGKNIRISADPDPKPCLYVGTFVSGAEPCLYDPSAVLSKFPYTNLYEERAILLGRLVQGRICWLLAYPCHWGFFDLEFGLLLDTFHK